MLFARSGIPGLACAGFVLFIAAAVSTGPADAQARNFFSPGYLGQPVAFCLDGNLECGKPAATAWCRTNGYEEALSFARRTGTVGEQLRFADSGNLCTGDNCIGFRQIRCFKPAG
jgi:hypothetical protein